MTGSGGVEKYGRGGGGVTREVLPLQKGGGGGKVLAILRGGGGGAHKVLGVV